jgi:beta-glucosidase-like glycosyl hydrolase
MGYESYSEICTDCSTGSFCRWYQLDILTNGRFSREPRWGRVSEGSGEDPYLGSEIAKAMVYGYQGKDLFLKYHTGCVKHFAYGAPEGGRDYNTVDMSHIRMFNEYFPPYKAAVDAGVGSVMASLMKWMVFLQQVING